MPKEPGGHLPQKREPVAIPGSLSVIFDEELVKLGLKAAQLLLDRKAEIVELVERKMATFKSMGMDADVNDILRNTLKSEARDMERRALYAAYKALMLKQGYGLDKIVPEKGFHLGSISVGKKSRSTYSPLEHFQYLTDNGITLGSSVVGRDGLPHVVVAITPQCLIGYEDSPQVKSPLGITLAKEK